MNQIETNESIAFSNWLKAKGYFFTHIANESGLPPKVAMLVAIKKKKMGVSPGFPDFFIKLKRKSSLYIELKRTLTPADFRKDGVTKLKNAPHPSPEQERWIEELAEMENTHAQVCYGLQEAIALVERMEKF